MSVDLDHFNGGDMDLSDNEMSRALNALEMAVKACSGVPSAVVPLAREFYEFLGNPAATKVDAAE